MPTILMVAHDFKAAVKILTALHYEGMVYRVERFEAGTHYFIVEVEHGALN